MAIMADTSPLRPVHSEMIRIAVDGSQVDAYMATPPRTPAPAVVVLQEIFGINNDIKLTSDELASAGFVAVAPDLFWRKERGVNLNSWSDDDWKKGFSLYGAYDRDLGVRDIAAIVQAARHLPGTTGKVAVMGFCLGGLMSYLMAARQEVDAAVAYHGGDTEKYLNEAHAIRAPLLMHLGEEDEFINRAAQQQIKAALSDLPNATVYSYPGQYHAFARHTGTHYNAAAARLANSRTRSFLAQHLKLGTAR
jgi:carboxymethylenebutenolidase